MMGYWDGRANRTNLNKMFCCDCESILKSTSHICSKCRSHTVSVGKKARWPKFPKKSDYEHFALLVAYSCSAGHPWSTLESVKRFVMKHGDARDLKNVEKSMNFKKEKEEQAKNAPVRPETIMMGVKLTDGAIEFYRARGALHNPKIPYNWVVNADVLANNYSIDTRHIKKIFIPLKTKIYSKNGVEMVSKGIPVFDKLTATSPVFMKGALAFFGCERDALLYSREIAEAVLREKNVDKRVLNEAKMHLKHCDDVLRDEEPRFYI